MVDVSSQTSRRRPVTVFASGGQGGGDLVTARDWAAHIAATPLFVEYGVVDPPVAGRVSRREAERDAADVRTVAVRAGARRAVGLSRGARALVGVLANDAAAFDRVVLVLPPGGTAAGRYREWLAELPQHATGPVTAADILVLALRGDAGHPVAVAEGWANRLGAQLEVYESLHRRPDVYTVMREHCREFLS